MKKILFFSFLGLISFTIAKGQNYAFPLKTSMWHTNRISVCWDNPESSNNVERRWVQEAISATWEKHSAVRFTGWKSAAESDADVHIYISDENPKTEHLGSRIRNMRKGVVLNFTFQNFSTAKCQSDREFCIKAIAVHEFGHVLGFAHEQNKSECRVENCLEKASGEDGDWHMNQCDLSSIMNYCNPAWNNRGFLSPLDIKALQYFYQPPGNRSGFYGGFDLVHVSKIINRNNLGKRKINHQFNIFVIGDEDKMKNIQKVVYFLDDDSFKNSAITVRNANDHFGLGLKVWTGLEPSLVHALFSINYNLQAAVIPEFSTIDLIQFDS